MREMKALIWKEWRSCRVIFFLGLGAAVSMGLTGFNISMLLEFVWSPVACMLGASAFASEQESRGSEFLSVQPLSKNKIWLAKVITCMVLLFLLIEISVCLLSIINITLSNLSHLSFMRQHKGYLDQREGAEKISLVHAMSALLPLPYWVFPAGWLAVSCLFSNILRSWLSAAVAATGYFLSYVLWVPVAYRLVGHADSVMWAECFLYPWTLPFAGMPATAAVVAVLASSWIVFRHSERGGLFRVLVGLGSCAAFLGCIAGFMTLRFYLYSAYH